MRIVDTVRFFRHLEKMGEASGGKRIFYAFVNIIIMALGVGFAMCVVWLFKSFTNTLQNFVLNWMGIIVCIGLTLLCFLQGFIAQLVLAVTTGVGMFRKEPAGQRAPNAVAFVIAFSTTVGLVVGVILYLIYCT